VHTGPGQYQRGSRHRPVKESACVGAIMWEIVRSPITISVIADRPPLH